MRGTEIEKCKQIRHGSTRPGTPVVFFPTDPSRVIWKSDTESDLGTCSKYICGTGN